jgi:serine/threonine-protein kinase
VAVKVLRPELAAALGADRFHREIEIAANLHHPHILPLYDSGDADGFLYYVMPYEEGQSLRDKLAKEGELPIPEAVRILRDVVDALSEAHEKGVVHRDIKPDNVLLTKHHALVTDFGVAKAVSEATGAHRLTTEGVALGTPAYMSPEQAAADKHIDHRADIYAVGALAYELLTGRPPFTGTTPQEVLSAQVTRPPTPVTEYRATVPPALEQLVMKCLEKKAADRWQSAEELLPQLEALATPSGGITPTGTMPAGEVLAPRRKMFVRAAALLGVLVLVVVGGWLALSSRGEAEGSATIRSLAVLPLDNLMGDPEQAHFVDGLHDILIGELSRVEDLTVRGRTSVLRYRETEQASSEIAAELAVDALVTGSVFRAGDSVRIQVQLIRGSPETVLSSHIFHGRLSQALALQSRVVRAIAGEIEVVLSPQDARRLASKREVDPEVQEAYYRGRALWRTRSGDGLRRSVTYLEEAVRLDSTFALAWAGLADAYMMGQVYGVLGLSGDEAHGRAEAAATKALELDATLAEAHAALANVRFYGAWDRTEAETLMRRAIDLNPSYAQAHDWLGDILTSAGRLEAALIAYQQARELDPFSALMHRDVGQALRRLGRCDDAMEHARTSLELDPEYVRAYRLLRDCHITAGRYDEAVEAEILAGRVAGTEPSDLRLARRAYDDGGWMGFLEWQLETIRAELSDGRLGYTYRRLVETHTLLGNADEALRALQLAVDARDGFFLIFGMSDPLLEPLRGDPRWEQLMQRAGL